jgi:hypothetical protein
VAHANDLLSVTMERWRWEDLILSVRRYASFVRGDDDTSYENDIEWGDEIEWTADRLSEILKSVDIQKEGQ